ncbi:MULTISPECIES: NADH-quinone oxidoreductase subunit C [unclassified Meiothermus]|uniref:NADH-quinone oxidoreductase subunit C n=1 Tax=unclassified Meiothermus TaxID=370471 RepID=UPI000D7BCCEF|nr:MULTISPECIES: NADH-quinone oxidoreductase subunit C [unclassified Meiothermus]PZA07355.1 NADH-quinone oxidoreductase subunit C [Meiothermus sp. Pnk-1]RYM37349.1 NADH-quinone oxidoreductase subunit C [Meiothermus sp. PNK-Is4]
MTRLEQVLQLASAKGWKTQSQHGNTWVVLSREEFKAQMRAFQEMGFNYLADIVGIDYLNYPEAKPERFSVVYELVSLPGYKDGDGSRMFVRVYLPERDPVIPTVVDLWLSADYLEREVYDLFGIRFEGHPDLRKILTPEDLEGHPLRKDYPLGETPTLFKEGRFIDPAAFRAGLTGKDSGMTGWRGGTRRGYQEVYREIAQVSKKEGQ